MKEIVVLPAYNEAKYIGRVLDALSREFAHSDIGVVVIDDGSSDETRSIVERYNTPLIKHAGNKGLGQTFRTAVDYCLQTYVDHMVFFDADGQFHVEDIERILKPLREGKADFVLGSRFIDSVPKEVPLAKSIGNRLLAKFISLVTGKKLHDVACGFRAYSREALLRVNVMSRFTYTQEVILDLLFKNMSVVEVPIKVSYFKDRASSISSNLWSYGWRVFKIISRAIRDYKPLTFFGVVGSVVFFAGTVLDVWIAWHFLQAGSFSPYKIIGFGGAFLNFLGLTIWFIGLVAEMLNRIRKSQDEILYLERKKLYR